MSFTKKILSVIQLYRIHQDIWIIQNVIQNENVTHHIPNKTHSMHPQKLCFPEVNIYLLVEKWDDNGPGFRAAVFQSKARHRCVNESRKGIGFFFIMRGTYTSNRWQFVLKKMEWHLRSSFTSESWIGH